MMEFGLSIPHFRQVASPENIERVAALAEKLEFDALWVTDHVLLPQAAGPMFGPKFLEPLSVLAYTAGITNRIRIGTSVMILSYRNAILAAKMLATIDVLSRGRLIAGVGSGASVAEFEALGVSFEDRGARNDEALQVFKELWTNPEPKFAGKYYRFDEVSFEPKPVQKPHPPIWVGGVSKRAIRRAVEFGDAWHPTAQEPAFIAEHVSYLRKLAEERGRDPDGIKIAARVGHKILAEPNPDGPRMLIGTADQVVDQIKRYQEAGVSHFVIDLFYRAPEIQNATIDDVITAIERLATEIRPRVQSAAV